MKKEQGSSASTRRRRRSSGSSREDREVPMEPAEEDKKKCDMPTSSMYVLFMPGWGIFLTPSSGMFRDSCKALHRESCTGSFSATPSNISRHPTPNWRCKGGKSGRLAPRTRPVITITACCRCTFVRSTTYHVVFIGIDTTAESYLVRTVRERDKHIAVVLYAHPGAYTSRMCTRVREFETHL